MRCRLETAALGASVTVGESTLARWSRRVCRLVKPRTQLTISVAYVSPHRSALLNRRYRGKRNAADVLCFDLGSAPGDAARHVQIVLCPAAIRVRARAEGTTVRSATIRLFVHGLLHAFGYHHARARTRLAMERLERRLLRASPP